MRQLLDHMAAGDYESGARLLAQLEAQLQDSGEADALQPELGLVRSALAMADGEYAAAEREIRHSLRFDRDHYELYFSLGLCYEQTGQTEAAYYAYRLALFLGRKTADEAEMRRRFEELCAHAQANAYLLGRACQQMIEFRLALGEYEKTFSFLGEQLYDQNRVAAGVVLTQENMLLYMLLEITLCEARSMSPRQFQERNSCVRYHGKAEEFYAVYRKVKLLVRRIWFGAPAVQQEELNDLIEAAQLNADQLAVIAKYSVRQEYWQDLFARLAAVVQTAHPQIGAAVARYRDAFVRLGTGGEKNCTPPREAESPADIFRLDFRTGEWMQVDQAAANAASENQIAFIFCANDELYCAECIRYLKRLNVPAGMGLTIVSVWHAPGMAAGYNAAMDRLSARYKIYIHQDTFIIEPDLPARLIAAFHENAAYGMLGIAGTTKLNDAAKWWQSPPEELRMNLYQDAVLEILRSVSVCSRGTVEPAAAADGILLATSTDIRWQETVYDGWHFYDIRQCVEFCRQGWRVGVLNSGEPVVLHETTMKKDPADLYDRYRQIFIKEAQRK